jgi:hypothetical protein
VALVVGGCSPDSDPLTSGPPLADTGALAVTAHLHLDPRAMIRGQLTASVLLLGEEPRSIRTLPVSDSTAACVFQRLEPGAYGVDVRVRDEREILGRGTRTVVVFAGGTTHLSIDLEDESRVLGSSWDRTAAPKALSPAPLATLDNACMDPRFADELDWTFTWSEVAGASRYHILVEHPGQGIRFQDQDVSDAAYHHRSDEPVAQSHGWQWKVRARQHGDWGPWSETREFRVEPAGTDCAGLGCFPDLPAPQLAFVGTEEYEVGGRELTRYILEVTNWFDYPEEMFDAAPNLPPCGLNDEASRTWVSVLGPSGNHIYGFCAKDDSEDLTRIWFAESRGVPPPSPVRVRLHDRACDLSYLSEPLPLVMVAASRRGPQSR